MRRSILGAFLLCAACGGGVRSADPGVVSQDPAVADQRAARTAVELSADARAAIVGYEKTYGEDAVESCLQWWIEGGESPDSGVVFKPEVESFQRFLAGCLGVPGDLRGQNTDAMRAPSTGAMRAPNTDAMRAPSTDAMRAPSTDAMRAPSTDAMRSSAADF